jgi:hypothetical protein
LLPGLPSLLIKVCQVYGEVQGSYPRAALRVLELKGIPEPVRAYALTE